MFIKRDKFEVGDIVVAKIDIEMDRGIFLKGHEFRIFSIQENGRILTLQDLEEMMLLNTDYKDVEKLP